MNKEILKILPERLKEKLQLVGSNVNIDEIRLRAFKKVILVVAVKEVEIDYIVTLNDILEILVNVSKNSIYAIQNDINNGFIVINGGHRVGITGEVVMQGDTVKNIKNISSMNIRVARQVIGCADKIMPYIIKEDHIASTLIISPPGCGKTTILRDTVRQLSSGSRQNNFNGVNVSLVDERGEIAAVSQGITNLDVGIRTDVMSNIPKHIGIEMLVRSMAPKVIATDEIGSKNDIEAIRYASLSGVAMVFTMHGSSLNEILKKVQIKKFIDDDIFETAIFLSNKRGPGTIENVYSLLENKREVV